MIAPIPIISRIDPKKGNEVFNKWIKTCLSTYLDLFIRLIGIFFAIYIIKLINQSGYVDAVTGESTQPGAFVKVFILIGALMFAKQLPKLIKDITGFDMGGGTFTLNPFKKISQVPLVGAGLSTGAAIAGGAIAGGMAGKEAGHIGRGVLQGAWGAASGLKGKVSMMGGDGKNAVGVGAGFQSGYKSITGKDYAVFNPLKYDMLGHGESQIDRLKAGKNVLYELQAGLDADLQDLYKAYQAAPENERAEIRKKITENRAEYGKLTKDISTLDDQISDVKRIYKFDESKKGDVNKILARTEEYERTRSISNGNTVVNQTTNVTNVNTVQNTSQQVAPQTQTSNGNNQQGGYGQQTQTSNGNNQQTGGQGQSGNQQQNGYGGTAGTQTGGYSQSQYSTTNSGHYTANPEDGADSFWE